ncbi:MAG TPA: phosphatase PAP2 family protein [Acidimicrobiales bacterium]
MWLGWQPALVLAALLALLGLTLRGARGRTRSVGAVAREAALVLALYAVWRFVMRLRSTELADGLTNGHSVWQIERWLRIGNEAGIEHWVLGHPWLMRSANVFYATVHVPALICFLVWLFARHRDRYPSLRNTVAAVTGICLVLHFLPVAPPRMYPHLGFVDAARTFGQSVYGPVGQGISNQVSALPSLHAAWAFIVALGVILVSSSRWRWWILAHPVLTMLVIVATANHWWLDGIAAGVVLLAVVAAQAALATWRSGRRVAAPVEVPVREPAGGEDRPVQVPSVDQCHGSLGRLENP